MDNQCPSPWRPSSTPRAATDARWRTSLAPLILTATPSTCCDRPDALQPDLHPLAEIATPASLTTQERPPQALRAMARSALPAAADLLEQEACADLRAALAPRMCRVLGHTGSVDRSGRHRGMRSLGAGV